MILAPLARLLVANGVPFADLSERMKIHYLTAAKRQAGARATDSRLSVLTGLQRRDVRRLLENDLSIEPRKPNHLARLVALWQTTPGFAGRDLPRQGAGSFDELAAQVRRDIHPRTMLDALEAAGTVVVNPETDTVRLLSASYQPLAGSVEQLDYLADNAGDFLTAAASNVLGAGPPFFERATHYNQLSAEAIAELERAFREAEMDLLKTISAQAAALQASRPGRHRFRAGGYFFHHEDKS